MAEEKKILLDIQLNYQVISKQIDDTANKIANLKVEQFRLNEALKQAKTNENASEYEKLSAAVVKNAAEIKAYTQDLRNLDKQAVIVAQAQKAEVGSYEETLRVLQLKRTSLKLLEDTMQRNADGSIELTAQYVKESAEVKRLADAVISFDQKIKDGRTNVGNYAASLEGLFNSLNGLTSKLDGTKGSIDNLNNDFKAGVITSEQYAAQNQALAEQLVSTQNEIAKVSDSIEQVSESNKQVTQTFSSFKEEVRAAERELYQIGQTSENTSAEYQTQKTKVAELKAGYKDLQNEINSLDPDTKFKAFSQVLSGVAGGISGAVGAMALFGDQSDATQQALLKVQGALAFAQGIDQITQLGDAWKNVKSVLGITTAATTAQAAAQTLATEAAVTGAVANTELAAAEGAATVATASLTASVEALLGPIGLVIVGIGLAVAAYKTLTAASVEQERQTERLIANAERLETRVKNSLSVGDELLKAQQAINDRSLALAESEKQSDTDLFSLKIKNAQALRAAQEANIQRNIENIQEEERNIIAIQKARVSTTNEDTRKKLDAQEEEARKSLELLRKSNDQIVEEQKNLNTELQVEQNKLEEQLRQTAAQAQTIRLGLIRDNKTREIELERDTLKSKLDAIRGNTQEEISLRTALESEASQKIKEIKYKYAVESLQTTNENLINSTVEGTQARIDAEEKAEVRLRDILLKNVSLTEVERRKIIEDSYLKMKGFEEQRVDVIREENKREIELEISKQETLSKLRQAQADPNDINAVLGANLNAINQSFIAEQAQRNINRDKDLQDSETYYAKQIELLQFNEDFKAKTIEDRNAIVQGLVDKGRQEQANINAQYDAADLLALQNSTNAIQAEIDRANQEKLNKILEQKQLELDASGDLQEQLQIKLDILTEEENAEIKKAERELKNKEDFEKKKSLIEEKYNNLRKGLVTQNDQAILASVSSTLGGIASLYKKGSEDYKFFATSQAIVDTMRAATAALAPPPTGAGPVFGPILAATTIATGYANIAKINSTQAYEHGGYTTDQVVARYNPTWVGTFSSGGWVAAPQLGLVGEKGKELVISNRTLSQDPAFFDSIEYWNRTGIRPFADGGFTDSTMPIMIPIQVQGTGVMQQQSPIDYGKLAQVVVEGLKGVTIIADPVEMLQAQGDIIKAEARADI